MRERFRLMAIVSLLFWHLREENNADLAITAQILVADSDSAIDLRSLAGKSHMSIVKLPDWYSVGAGLVWKTSDGWDDGDH